MLGNIFGSIGLGAITGLVGPIVTGFTNYKMKKLEQDHAVAMLNAESEAMKAEAEMKIEVTREETRGAVELEEIKAYTASQQPEPPAFDKSYMNLLPKWIKGVIALGFAGTDMIKKTVRPFLTYYVMICATWVTWLSWAFMRGHLEGSKYNN